MSIPNPDAEDLARSVTVWECAGRVWNDSLLEEGLEKAWHLSVIDHWNFRQYPFNVRRMQTVLYFADDHHKTEVLCNYLIPNARHAPARVLDLHHMNVETLHEDVWKLKHLRYINLSHNRRIEMLPPEITDLLNLQTLKLSGCCALKELSKDMAKVVALRHLYINGCRKLSLTPKGLGDLKFLNILTDFILPSDDSSSVDSANIVDLCKLNNLRGSLRITNLGYSKATRERFKIHGLLDEKSSLESLELIFRNLPTDTSLLDKHQPHPNFKALKIQN